LLEVRGEEEPSKMPRKQRFKPSRKPKAIGTLTDFAPLDRTDPPAPAIESTGPQAAEPGVAESDDRIRDDTDLCSPEVGPRRQSS
jgi:hypothetical protein